MCSYNSIILLKMSKNVKPVMGIDIETLLSQEVARGFHWEEEERRINSELLGETSADFCMTLSQAEALRNRILILATERCSSDSMDTGLVGELDSDIRQAVRLNRLDCYNCLRSAEDCIKRDPGVPVELVRLRSKKFGDDTVNE